MSRRRYLCAERLRVHRSEFCTYLYKAIMTSSREPNILELEVKQLKIYVIIPTSRTCHTKDYMWGFTFHGSIRVYTFAALKDFFVSLSQLNTRSTSRVSTSLSFEYVNTDVVRSFYRFGACRQLFMMSDCFK